LRLEGACDSYAPVVSETEIRELRGDELELLEPLWSALREHHASVMPHWGPPRERAESWALRRARYEEWLAGEDAFALVAVDPAGTAVGYAMTRIDGGSPTWQTGRTGDLETLAVLPGARSHGLGSRLLDAVYAELKARDVHALTLYAVPGNVDALRFYERHGFGPAGVVLARDL
jgi:ribosomal protein S18 acetylase RimI-like enzyme